MEVSGKKLSDQDRTYCQPCSEDGKNIPADAFCTVCKEYLCSTCENDHRTLKATKRHTLIDKRNMPTLMTENIDEDDSNVPCDIHPKEFIKYFCPAHETINCGHCLAFEHRSCKISLVSDISDSFINSQDYSDIKNSIARLLKDVIDCFIGVESNIKMVSKIGEDEVQKLKVYREKVNNYFDEREKSLLDTIEQMKYTDKTRLDSLKPKYANIKAKLDEMKCKFDAQVRNSVNLFIEAKKVRKQVECLEEALNDISKENIVQRYEFIKDTATEKLLAESSGLGIVSKDQKLAATSGLGIDSKDQTLTASSGLGIISKDQTIAASCGLGKVSKDQTTGNQTVPIDLKSLRFTAAEDIPVRSPSDIEECRLISMLHLPEDRLLLADNNNSAVKLVDLQTSSMVSQIELPGRPWGMCVLPGDKVAVCLYDKRSVVFLETRGQITVGNSIKVDGNCLDLAFHNGEIFVSFAYGRIVKMDVEGNIIKKIDKDKSRSFPNLTLMDDGQKAAIFVSDYMQHTITKLDMDLNIIQTFNNPAMQNPRGLTAVGNQLLICCYGSHKLLRLDSSRGKMIEIMGKSDGIQHPYNAVYSQGQNKLYITSSISGKNDLNNIVHVYRASRTYKLK